MSITSYAQNFEDVMLWRALEHVEHGFYIDIGAQDPVVDSVSLAFHEHGWRGIHVEPLTHYAELLKQQRPGDTVIAAAAGTSADVLQFYEIPDTGISTAEPSIAQQHRERGFDVREITVPSLTLSSIFDLCSGQEIHWLKIDVEGYEQQVLSGWGNASARPWIVVIESTLPLTQTDNHENWESLLLSRGYTPAYFDGLNRFYISAAHPELKNAFLTPPNIYDGFTLNGTSNAAFHRLIKERYEKQIGEAAAQLEQQAQAAMAEIGRLTRREQESTAQLVACGQKAEREKAELARSHDEHVHALHREHTEREKALTEQITQAQQEREDLKRTVAQREQELAEHVRSIERLAAQEKELGEREHVLSLQVNHYRQEFEILLRKVAQREREFGTRLVDIQWQAAQEKADQANSHNEQLRALRRENAEREQALARQLQMAQDELHRVEQDRTGRERILTEQTMQARQEAEDLLRTLAQREQDFGTQLDGLQRAAAQEKEQQTQSHIEQLFALRSELAAREKIFAERLDQVRYDLESIKGTLSQKEHDADRERSALQGEIQALRQAAQAERQQHNTELSTKLEELDRLSHALHGLQNQIQNEQYLNRQLRQMLADAQRQMTTSDGTFISRIMAALRIRGAENSGPRDFDAFLMARHADMQKTMPTAFLGSPRIASQLHELLSLHDQQFIHCAYWTLLGREPDPEGLHYYTWRLNAGYSKLQVLAQLRLSAEGKTHVVTMPGLDKTIQRFRRAQAPLVGWVFRLFNSMESDSSAERRLRSIHNQLRRLGDESNAHITKIEAALAGLRGVTEQKAQPSLTQQKHPASTAPDTSDTPPIPKLDPDRLKQLSPRVRDIYSRIKSAIESGGGTA